MPWTPDDDPMSDPWVVPHEDGRATVATARPSGGRPSGVASRLATPAGTRSYSSSAMDGARLQDSPKPSGSTWMWVTLPSSMIMA